MTCDSLFCQTPDLQNESKNIQLEVKTIRCFVLQAIIALPSSRPLLRIHDCLQVVITIKFIISLSLPHFFFLVDYRQVHFLNIMITLVYHFLYYLPSGNIYKVYSATIDLFFFILYYLYHLVKFIGLPPSFIFFL